MMCKPLRERERERFANILLLVLSALFVFTFSVFAEGSKNFNSSDSGARVFTIGIHAKNNFNPPYDVIFYDILTGDQRYVYAYAKAGETISIGTSYTENTNDLRVIQPNGSSQYYDVTTTSAGYIKTYLQERCGPSTIYGGSGSCVVAGNYYTPIKITASQTGLYKIAFIAADVNEDWTISRSVNVTDSLSSWRNTIAAWDVTVSNGKTAIPGRVFCYELRLINSSDTQAHSYNMMFYTLTEDGYIYRYEFPDTQGGTYYMISNKNGMTNPDTGKPIYHSLRQQGDSGKYTLTNMNINKIFFNYPDADLLSFLGLSTPVNPPAISNFSFSGVKDNATTPGTGGVFSFTSSAESGTYQIVLPIYAGNTVTLQGSIIKGTNTVTWNGNDEYNNKVTGDPVIKTATLNLYQGESHFVFFDIEGNEGGVKVQRLNGSNSDDADLIYYDNEAKYVNSVFYASLLDKEDHSTYGNGVHSSSAKILAWQNGDFGYAMGNQLFVDFWTNVKTSANQSTKVIVANNVTKNISVTKLWDDDNWNTVFQDMRVFSSDGNLISYSVSEEL